MNRATLRLLTVVGTALALSAVGFTPANAAPVVSNAAVSAKMVINTPTVTIKKIGNFDLAKTSSKRTILPLYSTGAGAKVISTRLTVATTAGKVLVPTATKASLSPGSYKVTTTIRYSYKSGTKTLTRTVSKTQTLTIGIKKPAPKVTIKTIADSNLYSAGSTRTVKPSYSVGAGANVVSAKLKVLNGSTVVTNSANSVKLKPGTYTVTSTVKYSYLDGKTTKTKTVTKTQTLKIIYSRPVTQPGTVDQSNSAFEQGVVDAFNAKRAQRGLSKLKTSAALDSFNNRWIDSKFTSNESPQNVSPTIFFLRKSESGFTGSYDPAAFVEWQIKEGYADSNINTGFLTHISVQTKVINGYTYVGIVWTEI